MVRTVLDDGRDITRSLFLPRALLGGTVLLAEPLDRGRVVPEQVLDAFLFAEDHRAHSTCVVAVPLHFRRR